MSLFHSIYGLLTLFISALQLNFNPCPAPSRAWVPGSGTAGEANTAGLPDITGYFLGADYNADSYDSFTGAFRDTGWVDTGVVASGTKKIERAIEFRAFFSNPIYGGSATVMPPSINTPHAIYLGATD